MKRLTILAVLVGLVALPLLAQVPTGNITGHVTDGKDALPGVTVTVTSPNLQGSRTAVTTASGDYIIRFLPPGDYRVRFELQGFQTLDTTIKISAAQDARLDAAMPQAKVAEEVTVTGSYETISATATASTTFESKLMNSLPVARDVGSYVSLTPGTANTGPNGATVIGGAMSFESLYMVNGVQVQDNIRLTALPLYIEDSIQESTTSISNVSAEYGRFTGGVVNTLTKSGGNEFHGSLRLNLSNPKWTAATPKTVSRADVLGKVWEGTLGGFVLKDKLWFFLAGRTTTTDTQLQTYTPVNIPVTQNVKEGRYELKGTWSITPDHRVIGSYVNRTRDWKNYYFNSIPVYDLASFYDRSIPEDIFALNYTGVLSNSFFIEGQYSARHLTFVNSGGSFTDQIYGTPVWDNNVGAIYWSPIFCAVCAGAKEKRDNQEALAKGSLFVSSQKAGSHDIRFGLDWFKDIRNANNWQSGSSYFLDPDAVNIVGTGTTAKYYPVVVPGSSFIEWWPINSVSKGTNFETESAFVNDVWRLNNSVSFNIGLRYDKNNGKDASGTTVVSDSKVSPRLSVTWDPKGDGDMNLSLGYGTYVAAIANSIADSQASGGQPAFYNIIYGGPAINVTANTTETADALKIIFNWLNNLPGGFFGNTKLWGPYPPNVPGYQTFIGNLVSPSTNEWALSFTKRLGNRGLARFDYINRQWSNFYNTIVTMATGTVTDPNGIMYDKNIITNTNDYSRKYQGYMLQADYRLSDRLQVGGNYTYSQLKGNFVGENSGSGPLTGGINYYPEYYQMSWNSPTGLLGANQTNKVNLYASWDILATKWFTFNASLLQRYLSGTPYGASNAYVNVTNYVTNPGYQTPPTYESYWFTARDAFTTPAMNATDIAVTFTFKAAGLEFWINPRVSNAFNNMAVTTPNTTVYSAYNGHGLSLFNPFTDTPKECPQGSTSAQCKALGANWEKGPSFGQATIPGSYQTPRTYFVNFGVRF